MTNVKSTKHALVSSLVALILCFSMLIGTTYAWFTDSAVSANNKITTGTLDVELYEWNGAVTDDRANAVMITDSKEPVFDDTIVWEPNYTEVVYLSIRNNGDLALKYKVAIAVTDMTQSNYSLAEVMEYAIAPDAQYGSVTEWAGNGTKVAPEIGVNETAYEDIELAPGEEHFFALSVHMLETAGNEYMNKSITFDIRVLAGQATDEEDAFGNDNYDEFAGYPGIGFIPAMPAGSAGVEIDLIGLDETKVGSILVPAAAAQPNTPIEVVVEDSDYKGNFTVASGSETMAYDVTVKGLVDGNTTPVKVQLKLGAGYDPTTVKLYHYDTEIDCSYDPNTGYVTFETATFSPFSIVYDAESVYVPKPALPENIPTAKISYYADWVDADIEWSGFNGIGPTEGLDDNIDAAFVFECPAEVDEAYRNWLCDFYVSLDRDLGENQIFLGGQYGSYLVGFHNGELTLEAGQEIPLLGTAISGDPTGITNWTYDQIESFVSTFTCGVGDVDGALEGATFTVALRLINPDDHSEYYDVNVVTHTFGGNSNIDGVTVVTTGDGLQDAINNGDGNISLGGDIDLNQGLVIN